MASQHGLPYGKNDKIKNLKDEILKTATTLLLLLLLLLILLLLLLR